MCSYMTFVHHVYDFQLSFMILQTELQMIKSTDANTAQVNVFYVSVACKLYTIPLCKGCNEYNYYWSYRYVYRNTCHFRSVLNINAMMYKIHNT